MHDLGAAGSHGVPENKRAALVIALLALLLAYSDIMGSRTGTSEIRHNLDASNLWAQYQAKTTRKKILDVAEQQLDVLSGDGSRASADAISRLRRHWSEDIEHYESDPKGREGRGDIAARARHAEELRDRAGYANDLFEYSSGLLHLAIVLASASVLIGRPQLLWGSIAAGGVSLLIMLYGLLVFATVA